VTRRPRATEQVAELAWRSIRRTVRQPASIIPAFLFPMFFLALNAGGLSRATDIPGFPTDSYLAFYLSMPFMQGALFATTNAGSDLGRDVQTKFLNRLALTPVPGWALLVGQLAGVLAISVTSSMVFLTVGVLAGVTIESGLLGVLVLVVLATLIAFAVSSIGVMIGVRSGSAEAVQGMFPLFFIFMFLSSVAMPRPLIEHDWFRYIATANPASYLIEALRSLIITGWDGQALALGFVIAAVIGALGVFGANRAMRNRMTRT
jgi:ABC-2 type transport system permease protein